MVYFCFAHCHLYLSIPPGSDESMLESDNEDTDLTRLELSSSSYRAGSTDIPDPLSPLLPIVHRPR